MGMNQLKPMIIVLLMLTSTLAGCTGIDTTDLDQQIADQQQSNNEMNETINQQNQANADLQTQLEERNTEIATLNSNVAMLQSSIIDAETYRDSLLKQLEDSNYSTNELRVIMDEINSTIISIYAEIFNLTSIVDHFDDFVCESGEVIPLFLVNDGFEDCYDGSDENVVFINANASIEDLQLIVASLLVNYTDIKNTLQTLEQFNWKHRAFYNSFSGLDLSYENLREANFRDADLSYTNLSYADLSYVTLVNSRMTNVDLSGAIMYRVHATDLWQCPASLPENWECRGSFTSNTLFGPYASLVGEYWNAKDLKNLNLTGADLRHSTFLNSNLSGTTITIESVNSIQNNLQNIIWINTICPDGTNSNNNGNTCENNL